MPEEKNELAPVEQEGGKFSIMRSPSSSFLNPAIYMQAKYIASDMMKDGALPKGFTSAGQAVMAMQAGSMMDLNWVESLQSLYFVNGSINIWGKAVPNRLRKHGYKFEFVEEDQTHCKARVWKEAFNLAGELQDKPMEEYIEDFKYSDAVKSGYTSGQSGIKIGWKEGINRIKKLRYNVLSLIISTYIPDVLGPVAGIVEVSQDYVDVGSKSEMAETIEGALKNRKAKKATMVEELPDFDEPKEENKPESTVTNGELDMATAGIMATQPRKEEEEIIVAELHIESDGDKTVEATTRTEEESNNAVEEFKKQRDLDEANEIEEKIVEDEETPSDGTMTKPRPSLEETIEKAKNYKRDQVITPTN